MSYAPAKDFTEAAESIYSEVRSRVRRSYEEVSWLNYIIARIISTALIVKVAAGSYHCPYLGPFRPDTSYKLFG